MNTSDENCLALSFDTQDDATAGQLANELEQDIRESAEGITVARQNANTSSQDFGSTLVLVFGTPVAITLARAVSLFLQRHSGASITISKSGSIVAKNLNSADAARIAEAFGGTTRRQ